MQLEEKQTHLFTNKCTEILDLTFFNFSVRQHPWKPPNWSEAAATAGSALAKVGQRPFLQQPTLHVRSTSYTNRDKEESLQLARGLSAVQKGSLSQIQLIFLVQIRLS